MTLFKLSLIPSSVGGLILIYKTYFGPPMYDGEEDLKGKFAIVTGASSGIGQEIAFELAKRNAIVIMGCRNMSECRLRRTRISVKSNNAEVYCSELDLNSLDSVKMFVERLRSRVSKVDIVVHNAGIKGGSMRKISTNYIEEQMAVNAIAPYLLNKLLSPLLGDDSRVVTLICPQYSKGKINKDDINFDKTYSRIEVFAQSQLMRATISNYFSKTTKSCYLTCDPGSVDSKFHANEPYNGNIVSRTLFRGINFLIMRNVWQAATTPIMCCCSPTVESGVHYRDLKPHALEGDILNEGTVKYVNALCDKWTSKYDTLNTNVEKT